MAVGGIMYTNIHTLWVTAYTLKRFVTWVQTSTRQGPPKSNSLTPREKEVLSALHGKLSNKEISIALGISIATVEFHLKNCYLKLGVHDRNSAAEMHAEASATVFGCIGHKEFNVKRLQATTSSKTSQCQA